MDDQKRVIIIGAGVTGLTAAYCLSRKGFRVTVIEASENVGGLASSLMVDGKPIEKYYHFICREDNDLIDFIHELGIEDDLHWREAKTGFFVQGRMYGFNSPWDLLRFSAIPFVQRLRFGLNVFISQKRKNWQKFDKIAAKKWLIAQVGRSAYQVIWDPLLRIKFGKFCDQISAAWIWHRIHRAAGSRKGMFTGFSYGFLKQGCFILIEALLSRLKISDSFELLKGQAVKRIAVENSHVRGVHLASDNKFIPADKVVSTVAIPNFLKLIPSLNNYTSRLSSIEYLNIVCMLLQLDRPLTTNFWLNINDPRIALNGIIEFTNLNPRTDFDRTHFLYIPFYLHQSDPRWSFSEEQLYEEYTAALKLIRPDFDRSWIKNWWVSKDIYAQAICREGFLDIIPNHETPLQGLYMTDSSQYYPEDRTISASVKLGHQVASLVGQASS